MPQLELFGFEQSQAKSEADSTSASLQLKPCEIEPVQQLASTESNHGTNPPETPRAARAQHEGPQAHEGGTEPTSFNFSHFKTDSKVVTQINGFSGYAFGTDSDTENVQGRFERSLPELETETNEIH